MTRQRLLRARLSVPLVLAGLVLVGCASGGPEASVEPPEPASTPTETPETPAAPTPSEDPATPAAGIFTDAQASRGRTMFNEVCSECHTTSEFRGRAFQSNWGRRTVYSFYRTIRSTMPDDNPGGLEEQVYLDVSAYILSLNGHDGGSSELSADSPMREVRIAPPEPQP